MCNMLSAIGNTVSNTASTVVNSAVQFGKSAVHCGGQIVGYVTPKLSPLLAKIQNIHVPSYLAGAWTMAKSSVGVSAILLTASIAALIASRRVESRAARTMWLVAGATAMVLSAVMVTKPFGFAKV